MINETRPRSQQKAERRALLLRSAARLFADQGFRSVRLEDLGAAAGISGPAVYRHFANKENVLTELLVGISIRLLEGGRKVVADSSSDQEALENLIDFHVDFALNDPELIRIQDRDFTSLPQTAKHQVRRLQREYVEVWVSVQTRLSADLEVSAARTKAHAALGLINSTPHSVPRNRHSQSRQLLRSMARAALLAPPAD
ncbi:TetR/AcrR family transcriptional regulator [Saxibacter everestensis]|uniref:TetR/AcrR family transcriptional regulator n=1 Tax=Saxibacter everestensis TaxID=2909229 RepID=A0ABY8QQ07_9MICO|nr:TetR/AcrR family transcriptional regulator [Brevibacteriaceae bacterium ZFBP1038]